MIRHDRAALSILVDSDGIVADVMQDDVVEHDVCDVTPLFVFEFDVTRKHGAPGGGIAKGDISECSVITCSHHEAIALTDNAPFYEDILRWRFEHDAVVTIANITIVDVDVVGSQVETVSIWGNVIRRRINGDVSNDVVFPTKISSPGGLQAWIFGR